MGKATIGTAAYDCPRPMLTPTRTATTTRTGMGQSRRSATAPLAAKPSPISRSLAVCAPGPIRPATWMTPSMKNSASPVQQLPLGRRHAVEPRWSQLDVVGTRGSLLPTLGGCPQTHQPPEGTSRTSLGCSRPCPRRPCAGLRERARRPMTVGGGRAQDGDRAGDLRQPTKGATS